MLVSELRVLTKKLINSYSSEGQTLPVADNADLDLVIVTHLNTAQNKFSQKDKIQATHSISQYPAINLLGDTFDIVQHTDEDLSYSATGAKSYTLEVDHPATVYIEEETAADVWTTLATLTLTPTSFTEYKGLITASDVTNAIRLRFSGSYPYRIRRYALYAYLYASTADIPQYKPEWNKYALPSDHVETEKIEYNGEVLADYYIQKKYLYIKSDLEGSVDVFYVKRPTTLVGDDEEPEISPENHQYLAYFAAGEWMMSNGKQSDGITRINQFEGFMSDFRPSNDETGSGIVNVNQW